MRQLPSMGKRPREDAPLTPSCGVCVCVWCMGGGLCVWAGRGTDILLGGNPALMAKLRVRDALVRRPPAADSQPGRPKPAGHEAPTNQPCLSTH